MVVLLALVSEAHALRVVCEGFTASDTVPGPGAEGVPVDFRPAVIFIEGCAAPGGWDASLRRDADAAEVAAATATHEDVARSFLFELFPDAELDPSTAYTFVLTALEEEAVSVGFTTGTGTVAGLTGGPTVTVESAAWDRRNGELIVELAATPVADPDALSVLQVKDGNLNRGVQSFGVPPTGGVAATVVWEDTLRPDEVCPQVRQIDGAGVATEWSTPECVAVTTCGCAATQPAAGLVGLALAVAATFRRRA